MTYNPLPYLKHLNRWQGVALVLGIIAIIVILVRQFIFKPTCLNTMCPAHDYTYLWRIGIVIVATAVAMWLLKSSQANNSESAQPPSTPAPPQNNPTPEQPGA